MDRKTSRTASDLGCHHHQPLHGTGRILPVLLLLLLGVSLLRGGEAEDLETVRARYLNWVLGGSEEAYAHAQGEVRLKQVLLESKQVMGKLRPLLASETAGALYDTTKRGGDEQEVRFLITSALPALSIAYHLEGSRKTPNPWYRSKEVHDVLMQVFDRLHERGFRHPMHLPWKPQQVAVRDPNQAIVVDFILRTSGYALATFLMRKELEESDRLKRAIDTCWEIESHPEKTGDLRADYLQADGVRVVVNVSLPAALAEGNAARLKKLRDQLHRSMLPESNTFDTLKPDGLGHHHMGVYPAGYAAFTMAQAAFAAWLMQDTGFACTPETVSHVARGLDVLRVISQKYDMHKALGGRFSSASVIPDVLLGYGYLADLKHPRRREFQGMLARLADDAYMASGLPRRTFSGHRDEVSPGPGCIAHFLKVRQQAVGLGAEPDPSGHWAFNYGPLSVHRREGWMVSIKGASRYWWAFERSLTDARKDPRQENVFGFHDGAGSLMIFGKGEPWVNAVQSGYAPAGWDWCRVPGTTTRHLTPAEMLALDTQGGSFNRPYSDATFVGGLSLEQRHGIFAIDYTEATPDQRDAPLKALKTAFFFDNQIVMLTSGIRNGDAKHPVTTTLYQTALRGAEMPTYEQGRPVTGFLETTHAVDAAASRLVDAAGNGYYIPAGNKVGVSRSVQVSMDQSATKESRGPFATAWIDHGVSPDNAGCEYVVLVRSGRDRLEDFAGKVREEYRVLRKDSTAHVVRQLRLGVTGYAVAKANTPLGDEFLSQASAPCLVMARDLGAGRLQVSACHPDLGWTKGRQYANKSRKPDEAPMAPVPTPLTLTLQGAWQVGKASEGVNVAVEGRTTRVTLRCADAQGLEFQLEPRK
jgi:chondroitin-sulfate-ABC endolyase/exolyase